MNFNVCSKAATQFLVGWQPYKQQQDKFPSHDHAPSLQKCSGKKLALHLSGPQLRPLASFLLHRAQAFSPSSLKVRNIRRDRRNVFVFSFLSSSGPKRTMWLHWQRIFRFFLRGTLRIQSYIQRAKLLQWFSQHAMNY